MDWEAPVEQSEFAGNIWLKPLRGMSLDDTSGKSSPMCRVKSEALSLNGPCSKPQSLQQLQRTMIRGQSEPVMAVTLGPLLDTCGEGSCEAEEGEEGGLQANIWMGVS